MARRSLILIPLVAAAAAAPAQGVGFVAPLTALPGVAFGCTDNAAATQRAPAVAGSGSGRAVAAALAPDCNVVAALRTTGSAFGPPQSLGGQPAGGARAIGGPVAAVNARGDAVVAWSTPDGCALAYAPGGSDTFGAAESPATFDGARCVLALDGAGTVLLARGSGIVDRSAGGAYGAPATPFPAGARILSLAANERGDAVAVARSDAGFGLRHLDVATRAAGGPWSPATRLATVTDYTPIRGALDVAARIDADGGVLVTFPTLVTSTFLPSVGNVPTATLMYAAGTTAGLGVAQPVPSPGPVLLLRSGYVVAANARGDQAIGFASRTGATTGSVVLTSRPAGAATFGPPQVIGTARVTTSAAGFARLLANTVPAAGAMAADGTLTLTQVTTDLSRDFVQARVRPPGGALGRPVWLSPPPGPGSLVNQPTEVVASAGPAGTALVAWSALGPGSRRTLAASPTLLGPAAAAGGTPPVTLSGVTVAVRKIRSRPVIRRLVVSLRVSRATTVFYSTGGAPRVLANVPAGRRTIVGPAVRWAPGRRVRVVVDVSGAGTARAVRTVTVPR